MDIREKYDVIVVGAGVAGLNAARFLPRDKKILLLSKESPRHSDSYLAQGGICVLKWDGDYETYFEDTMRAGHYENDPETVGCMLRYSRETIADLLDAGVRFTRDAAGNFLYTREGGHRTKRILYHDDCTGKEITEEWLYHLGIPEDQIEELAENHANCTPTMMPYITAFFMPRRAGDRPDVIPDGCVNAAFLGQFAETPRDTIFTTEYSVRTAMEAVYGLCGVDRGVPEVWGSVYDIRELLDSTVKLMDGRSPLEMKLPMPLEALKKPVLRKIDKTVVGKLLRDHGVLKDWMV